MSESSDRSKKRRSENERIFKQHNERIKDYVTGLLDPAMKQELLIGFTCECANEICQEKIEMPVNDYTKLRANANQFIVKKRHEQPDIERIVKVLPTYEIIEKTVNRLGS